MRFTAPFGKTQSSILALSNLQFDEVKTYVSAAQGTRPTPRTRNLRFPKRYSPAILGVFLLLVSCENDPAQVAALFPETRMDAEVISNFETIYSDSAQVRVRIRGKQMLRMEEDEQFVQYFPEGAHIDFFDEFGQVSSTLTCGYGLRYEDQERITLRDSVVWKSTAGDRLDTEELHWIAGDQRIYSDRFVRLRQSDKEITGVGFESNQDFTRAKVVAIQGIVSVKDSPKDSLDRLP